MEKNQLQIEIMPSYFIQFITYMRSTVKSKLGLINKYRGVFSNRMNLMYIMFHFSCLHENMSFWFNVFIGSIKEVNVEQGSLRSPLTGDCLGRGN